MDIGRVSIQIAANAGGAIDAFRSAGRAAAGWGSDVGAAMGRANAAMGAVRPPPPMALSGKNLMAENARATRAIASVADNPVAADVMKRTPVKGLPPLPTLPFATKGKAQALPGLDVARQVGKTQNIANGMQKGMADSGSKGIAGALGQMGSNIAHVAADLGKRLGGSIVGGIKTIVSAGGSMLYRLLDWRLLAGGALGAVASYKFFSTGLLEADDKARELGVSLATLQTLQLAGGHNSNAMADAMGFLTDKLISASMGSVDAARSFQRLQSLSGLKIDMGGGLASMQSVMGALAAIGNETTRAAIANDLFGASASKLAPEIARGGAAIANAQSLALRFGVGVGASSLEAMRQVAESGKILTAVWQGARNQLTVAGASLARSLIGSFDSSGLSMQNLGTTALSVGRYIGYGVAGAVETWRALQGVWDGASGAAKMVGAAWLQALGYMTDKLAPLQPMFNMIGSAATTMFNTFAGSIGVAVGLVTDFSATWDKLSTVVTSWGTTAGNVFSEAATAVSNYISSIPYIGSAYDAVAPIVTGFWSAVGSGIAEIPNLLASAGQATMDFASSAMEGLGNVLASIDRTIESTSYIGDAWKNVKGVVTSAIDGVLESVGWLWKRIQEFYSWLFSNKGDAGQGLRDQAGAMANSGAADFNSARDKFGTIGGAVGTVDRIFNEAGMNLPGQPPATPPGVAAAGKAAANLPTLPPAADNKIGQELQKQLQQMQEATKSPLEAFQETMKKIDAMKGAGLLGAGQEARFRTDAYQKYAQSSNLPSRPQFAGAVEEGSKEAYSAVTAFLSDQNKQTVQEKLQQLQEENNRTEVEALKVLQDLLREMQRKGNDQAPDRFFM